MFNFSHNILESFAIFSIERIFLPRSLIALQISWLKPHNLFQEA